MGFITCLDSPSKKFIQIKWLLDLYKKNPSFFIFFKRTITRVFFLIKEKKLIFNHCRVHSRIQPSIILTFELVNIMVNIFNFSINKHENEDR
jgi:hypothetical protein